MAHSMQGYKRYKVNVFLECISGAPRTKQERIYGIRFTDEDSPLFNKKIECTIISCEESAEFDEALVGLRYKVRIPTQNAYKECIIFKNELPRGGVEWYLFAN